MAEKTYNINFRANIQGIDNVMKQLQTILKMDNVNLTPNLQKQWQQLLVSAQSYIKQVQTELAKPIPDTNFLNQLSKNFDEVIKQANTFTNSLAGLQLPKTVSEQFAQLSKNIADAQANIKNLRFANSQLKSDLTSRGTGLNYNAKNEIFQQTLKDVGVGSSLTIDGKQITSLQEFTQAYRQLTKTVQNNEEAQKKYKTVLEQCQTIEQQVNATIQQKYNTTQQQINSNSQIISSEQQKIQQWIKEQQEIKDTASAQNQLTEEQKQFLTEVTNVKNTLTQLNSSQIENNTKTQQAAQNTQQYTIALNTNNQAQEKNTSLLTRATKTLINYSMIYATLRRILQATITTFTEMDEALTGMAVVTNMSREQAWEMAGTLQELGRETGLAATEIANAATMFYQQGKSTTQVLELTEAAAKAAAIAGIDLTTSVDLLTNAMNGFQMSANDAMEVSDKFAALAAAAATDYEELAVALSKVAAQANLAGMSMDFTLGMLTAGIEVTREAPETIGTALKTIIARMRELTDYGKTLEDGMNINRVAEALDNIGIALTDETGMMRDLEDVITEIGQAWDTLNTNQQANVAVAMAGTRQQSRFIAMMQDFERTQELVNLSMNSYGATLAQHSKYMDGLTAATNNLTTAWQSLITNFSNSSIFINFVNMLTNVVDVANVWLNDMHNIVPLLITIGLLGSAALSRKIQEYTLSRQIAMIEAQQRIAKNNAEIESIKNAAYERAMDQAALKDQKLAIARTKTQAALQRKTNNEELIASKKKLIVENQITAEIQRQNGQTEEAAKTEAEITTLQTELTTLQGLQSTYEQEYQTALQQQHQIESQYAASVKLTAEETLAIQQRQTQNWQAQTILMGSLGSIINGIVGPFMTIYTLGKAIIAQSKIRLAQTKANTAATVAEAGATSALATAEQQAATGAIARNLASALPIIGAIAAAAILGYTIISSIIASAKSNSQSMLDETVEKTEELQVELYELQNTASNIESLADEFDELSSKIGKSNDELERMKEIAQEVNDAAGYAVVDTTQSAEMQSAQMRGYVQYQRDLAQGTVDSIEQEWQKNLTDYTTFFSNSMTKEDNERFERFRDAGYNYSQKYVGGWGGTQNTFDITSPIIQDWLKSIQSSGQIAAFNADMRAIAQERITGLSVIDNTEVLDAILNSATQQADTIFIEGWDAFNDIFNASFLEQLDEVYTSGNLGDWSTFFNNLTEQQQQWVQEALPVFEIFNTVTNETAQSLDDLGIGVDELNTIFSNLTDGGENAANAFAEIINRINEMKFVDNNGELLKNEELNTAKRIALYEELAKEQIAWAEHANKVVLMSEEELNQAIIEGDQMAADYQIAINEQKNAQIAYDNAVAALQAKKVEYAEDKDGITDKEQLELDEMEQKITNDLAPALQLAKDNVNQFTNASANSGEVIEALGEELLPLADTSNITDSLTSLISTMERLSEVTDLASLSIEEQMELLKDYPELFDAMSRGYLTATDLLDLYQGRLEEIGNEAKGNLISLPSMGETQYQLGQINYNGNSLSSLFENSETGAALRSQILNMEFEDFVQLIEDSLGLESEKAVERANAILGSISQYNESEYLLAYIEDNGIAGLISSTIQETFDNSISLYNKATKEIEKYNDTLDRLNENSEEYNKILTKRNEAIIKANQEGRKRIEQIMEEGRALLGEEILYDKNGNVVDIYDLYNIETGIIDATLYDNLKEDSQTVFKMIIEQLNNFYEEVEEINEDAWDRNEELLQSYIDVETARTEDIIDQLESRLEAYEDYFDELDRIQEEEDYEQNRDSILQQLQALSGGSDAASKQKIKELQEELNSLNEEQLQSQTEAQRDALLSQMEEEIEAQNEILDNIENYLGELLWILENDNRTQEDIEKFYSVLAEIAPNTTAQEIKDAFGFAEGGLVNYTGIAKVHGTKSRPEAFLSAEDTINIRSLLDALAAGRDVDMGGLENIEGASNIIQIDNIEIHTDQLNTSQDFTEAGQALASEFARAIQKRGININVKR